MKLRALGEWLDDHLNPIVVKELRQAVQSRFVVAVLLFFLILQLTVVGIFIAVERGVHGVESLEFAPGRILFTILQGILLGTCVLFLPLYTGVRLSAERSSTNVDLLFVTTLSPRAIITGKFLGALVLGVMIFSACTPFLVFTYLLRGIDWPSILFIVAMDCLAVALAVLFAIFLAVVPANWLLKALLGLIGLAGLGFLFSGTLSLSILLLMELGVGAVMDTREFWAIATTALAGVLGLAALFYSWAVALISPTSANRSLLPRLVFLVFWAGSFALALTWNVLIPEARDGPIAVWIWVAGLLCCVHMVIAVNERESWSPRVARTIPKPLWLRLPAFLLYSGAGGGLILAAAMFAVTLVVSYIGGRLYQYPEWAFHPQMFRRAWNPLHEFFLFLLVLGLYIFAYALLARLVRAALPIKLASGYTWIVFLILLVAGNVLPFLITFLLAYNNWRFEEIYPWLVPSPIAGLIAVGESTRVGYAHLQTTFIAAASVAAGILLIFHLPWLARQIRAFRSFVGVRGPFVRTPEPRALAETQVSG